MALAYMIKEGFQVNFICKELPENIAAELEGNYFSLERIEDYYAMPTKLCANDVVVLDGLRFESHRTHMSIPEAVLVAQKIGANKTYLTHMTFQVDYDKHNMELPEGIELAYDGLKIVL